MKAVSISASVGLPLVGSRRAANIITATAGDKRQPYN
jgi:hypothetical protein